VFFLERKSSITKEIVEQQQYIFDTFWDRSIPAYQRILEIEKAAEIYTDLARSVEKEILLLFANSKAIIRADRLGVLDSLINASNNKAALVKIISPITQYTVYIDGANPSFIKSLKLQIGEEAD
jgi:hypothetical protein